MHHGWLPTPLYPFSTPPPHPSRQAYLALGLDKSGPLEVAVVDLPIDEWRKWLVALNRWDQRENINISQWKPYKDVKQKKEIPIKICQVYLSKSSFTEPWCLCYVLEHESYIRPFSVKYVVFICVAMPKTLGSVVHSWRVVALRSDPGREHLQTAAPHHVLTSSTNKSGIFVK